MDVTFVMTPADLRHFSRYCLLYRPSVVINLLMSFLGAGMLAARGMSFLLTGESPRVGWMWFALPGVIGTIGIWYTDFGVTAQLKMIPGQLGSVWLRISPIGVEERTPLTDEVKMWARVQEVVTTREAIYRFTEPCRAYLAPRRAFATPDEADAFLNLARGYWQAARESVAAAHTDPSDRDRAA